MGTAIPKVGSSRAASSGEATHTVKAGETLWSLAQKAYGDGNLWPAIRDANRGLVSMKDGKPIIRAGQQLVIPPKPQGSAAVVAPPSGPQGWVPKPSVNQQGGANGKPSVSVGKPQPQRPPTLEERTEMLNTLATRMRDLKARAPAADLTQLLAQLGPQLQTVLKSNPPFEGQVVIGGQTHMYVQARSNLLDAAKALGLTLEAGQ